MNDIEQRAFDAWTQGQGADYTEIRDQPSDATEAIRHGVHYVELTNANGVVATYRVRPSGDLSLVTVVEA